MIARATFDRTRHYRYTLLRGWDDSLPRLAFVMLNPSTADATKLDPTCTRCFRYAQAWGFGTLEVVNIFALRSTDPKGLYLAEDPVGPGNDRAIARAARRADTVVAAWGNHASLADRSARVRLILSRSAGNRLHHLRMTSMGEPSHPLYLPASLEPVRWQL
ncbi:MAG: DUF1643 domain-containing protein [Planctomycetota bacterium]